jgi:branched-chain amino acid transport system permease protein
MAQILENILQALAAGLLIGAIYGLMCVGLALIFGIMRVINFAQGDFMMLGMYAGFYLGLGLATQFGLSGVVTPYLGILLTALLISKVSGSRSTRLEGEGHYAQLILTLGVALILQNGALIAFGSQLISIRTPLSSSAWTIPLLDGEVMLFINQARGVAALISVTTIVSLTILIGRSRLGKALRAAADNPEAAIFMGIDVARAHRIAFALGVGVTAIAGGLLATNLPFHPFVGIDYVIVMYAGVVLGGMGSIGGAFWGGMTIGLVQQMSTLILPTQLQNAAIFAVFLLIIFFRPQGFFGRMVERT